MMSLSFVLQLINLHQLENSKITILQEQLSSHYWVYKCSAVPYKYAVD